jgi:hypothetical protein
LKQIIKLNFQTSQILKNKIEYIYIFERSGALLMLINNNVNGSLGRKVYFVMANQVHLNWHGGNLLTQARAKLFRP